METDSPPPSRLAGLPEVSALDGIRDASATRLRDRVRASGYGIELLGRAEAIAPRQFDAVRLPLVQAWLEEQGGDAALLAGLFAYAMPAEARALDAALGPELVAELVGARVLALTPRGVVSRYRLTPLDEVWVLADPPDAGDDSVMGPGPTTLELARVIGMRPGRVLDLGCGAGSMALLAAACGATRALGVDLNPRAIAIARFNARLNDLPAEFRAGDLLEPARGESFDLVLGQPPYVSQPEGLARTVYLHGGARGDELALRFAAAASEALVPGGLAVLHFDSAPSAEPLLERVRAALGDAAVDVVALAAPGPSLDLQAAAYASIEDESLGPRYRDVARRYRRHLATLHPGAFARVALVLRACDVPGGRIGLQLAIGGTARFDAAALARYLRGLDLAAGPDEALLATALRLAPGGRLVEEWAGGALEGEPVRSVRFAAGSLPLDREISDAGAFLFRAVDAAPTLAGAIAPFAEVCGEAPAAVSGTVLEFAREGLGRGLLVIA